MTLGFGLYVHWPFCRKKCPYCDFNVHIAREIDHDLYTDMLCRELALCAETSGTAERRLDSIFFGGGTPSLMHADNVGRVIDTAREIFSPDASMEITLEANPSNLETAKLAHFRAVGVNRLSLGIQSLDNQELALLGREHRAGEALDALQAAREIFTHDAKLSADFIYALPGQHLDDWHEALTRILTLGLDHLSFYQLTLEPATAFAEMARDGRLTMLDDDTALDLFNLTQSMTRAAGLRGYEISNHARVGAESCHNLNYWTAGDWLGVGPGATGRFWLGGMRVETRNRRNPGGWLDAVANNGHGRETWQAEQPSSYGIEAVMMGLRLIDGVSLSRIGDLAGDCDTWIDMAAVSKLCSSHHITLDDGRLALTDQGRPVINHILGQLLARFVSG